MAVDYSKFDEIVDIKGVKEDMKNNNGKDVPEDTYDVALLDLQLGETGPNSKTPGSPMIKAKFEIINGDYEGTWVWYNQVVSTGTGLNMGLGFIRSLIPDEAEHMEVRDGFLPDAVTSYAELGELLDMLKPFIMDHFEYALRIKKSSSGYTNYTVEEIYKLED